MQLTPPTKSEIKKYADHAIENIREILQKFGPREPGSIAETKTQQFFAEELKKITPKVEIQSFSVAPMGLLFFLPLTGVIFFFSSAVIFKHPIIAFLGTITSFLITYLQFGRYKRVLDTLLPKKLSHNVIATLSPSSAFVHRRLIICGHADSAYEMRYNKWGTLYIKSAVLILLTMAFFILLLSTLSLIEYLTHIEFSFLLPFLRKYPLVFGSIYGIVALGFIDFTRVVPGANDNLSGSVTAIEAFRWFANHPLELENTELICLITGSEEAGLRGAYAYLEKEYHKLTQIPTIAIVLDTLRDYDELGIVIRDMNGFIHHHKGVVSLLYQTGLECGVHLKPVVIFLGSSDATAFAKRKIPASALVAMDPSPATYYHTRRDDINAVNEDTIIEAIRIVIQAIRKFDQSGLPENGPIPLRKTKQVEHAPESIPVN